MNRNIDGWRVMGHITQGEGARRLFIRVSHPERDITRDHELTGFNHRSDVEASRFVEQQVDGITGVSSDGSLKFR